MTTCEGYEPRDPFDTPEGYVNVPVPHPGTKEEKEANFWTHDWWQPDPDESPECTRCACRAGHVAGQYPCGEEPPRKLVLIKH